MRKTGVDALTVHTQKNQLEHLAQPIGQLTQIWHEDDVQTQRKTVALPPPMRRNVLDLSRTLPYLGLEVCKKLSGSSTHCGNTYN